MLSFISQEPFRCIFINSGRISIISIFNNLVSVFLSEHLLGQNSHLSKSIGIIVIIFELGNDLNLLFLFLLSLFLIIIIITIKDGLTTRRNTIFLLVDLRLFGLFSLNFFIISITLFFELFDHLLHQEVSVLLSDFSLSLLRMLHGAINSESCIRIGGFSIRIVGIWGLISEGNAVGINSDALLLFFLFFLIILLLFLSDGVEDGINTIADSAAY
mmetsp:Transcript_11547/g.10001  ORF Transcript_11547/g.10001 Transcript_11547/m.10001 type:complete len:215 (-) Transcript_11547:304-948(-)